MKVTISSLLFVHATLSWVKPDRTLIQKQNPGIMCDSECEVQCTQPPWPDCAEWGDCVPYEYCMPRLDGCPPPPTFCDWETENSCYTPPPENCERGCWGEDFCIPNHEMCPPPPVHCFDGEIKCQQMPDPECEMWGDCNIYEYCMPADDGCPPPPIQCDWETETSCWNPSPPDCMVGCWGTEVCAKHEEGCPPWPVHCEGSEMLCSDPPYDGCEEWGPAACHPVEYCMPQHEGCPPPPVNCDWETQHLCYSPPHPDCDGAACWGTEFCSGPDGCPMEKTECGEGQVVCSDPPSPDCAEWGSCEPYEFCMAEAEGCPPPPVNCDWAMETSCFTPPPHDCEGSCWGHEFCTPMEEGCPPPPVYCGDNELLCVQPPYPDCAEWGDCHEYEWCMSGEYNDLTHGCPPPPMYCDWETEAWCHTPPAEDCEGAACWGQEFCAPMEQGCPPIPLTCHEGEIICSQPPEPNCAEWGACHPYEFCMLEHEGCPPPPVYCDWETEQHCWNPPVEDCEHPNCWGTEWCARHEASCDMHAQGDKTDDSWSPFDLAQKTRKKVKMLRGKHAKKNGPAALSRSLYWHELVARTHLRQKHKPTPGMAKKPTQPKRTKHTPKQHSRMLGAFRREFINQRRMVDHVKHKKKHNKVSATKRSRLPKNAGVHMMYELRRVRHERKRHPKNQKKQAVRRAK